VLPNSTPPLLPGMYVRVELMAAQRPNAILIPQQAVVKVPTGHIAFVVGGDGKVERRDLVVGEWHKDDWIIEKGVGPGDRVVVEGVQRVQPGMTVKPIPYAPPGRAGPAPAAPAAATPQS